LVLRAQHSYADVSSEYVITCTDLEIDNVLGSSVTIVQAKTASENGPSSTDEGFPGTPLVQSGDERRETVSNLKRSSRTSVQLFHGRRVADYMVDDDYSDDTISLNSIQLSMVDELKTSWPMKVDHLLNSPDQ
jgi:hypothetical protein